jgi:hypothetical protein
MTLRPLVFVDGVGACECPQESAMVKIVVHVRGTEHPEFRVDGEVQPRVRRPQRGVHVSRAPGAREDESQVAGALRQRQQPLIRFRRDLTSSM